MTADVGALYDEHWGAIYGFLRRRMLRASREDVEDLTATVFVHVVRFSDRYRERGVPKAWLFALAEHALIDDYRHGAAMKRPATVALDSDAPGGRAVRDAGSERQVTEIAMASAMDRLTDRQRLVLVERYWMGASTAETALLLRCSIDNVVALRMRALARIRRELGSGD